MTNAPSIYILLASTLIGIILGYVSGYYTRSLRDAIIHLEAERDAPVVETPTITMGTYSPANPYAANTSAAPVGIAQSKSPQLVEFETEQAIEKRALG